MVHWQKLSKNFGIIHIIGIGGIGMSGIAEILANLDYKVQGSDTSHNANTIRLENLGIKVFIGHCADNLNDVSFIVRSSAINDDNLEIIAAKENSIPIISRAEMLAELMRLKISVSISGTHGKTTTTSLVSSLFESAELSPTVINGGIINTRGTNAYLGKGDYLIAEADESDGTFIKIPSSIAIITNIDPEHLDYYGSYTALKNAFRQFVENIPFYGFAVICKDHPEAAKLAKLVPNRRIITYGIDSNANIKGVNIRQYSGYSIFDVEIKDNEGKIITMITDIKLSIPGKHNVLNSLSAIGVAYELGFDEKIIKNGLSNFEGVKRRFTKVGNIKNVTFIDDYAHHPKEIEVTLATAKQLVKEKNGKVIAIIQPHRFTRLQNLMNDFAQCFYDADIAYILDVYAAGEQVINGINSETLVNIVKENKFHKNINYVSDNLQLPVILKNVINDNDLIIFLGAGNITVLANEMPKKIEQLMLI